MEYAIYLYTFTVIGVVYKYFWGIILTLIFGLFVHLYMRLNETK